MLVNCNRRDHDLEERRGTKRAGRSELHVQPSNLFGTEILPLAQSWIFAGVTSQVHEFTIT
jgi:hypothetical protein